METGKRYRLLIYFAVLVLCLSVCFAYAEERASNAAMTQAGQPAHLLFGMTPGHSSFLPPLASTLLLRQSTASAPTATADAALAQLDLELSRPSRNRARHGLPSSRHRIKATKPRGQEHLTATVGATPRFSIEGR